MAWLLALFLFQSPGEGWNLVHAPPREVKRVYWDLFETTEVWVLLLPGDPQGEPAPVNVVFQAFFPGRAKRDPYSKLPEWPKGEPERLTVRVQPFPTTVLKEPSLRLVVDDETFDLGGILQVAPWVRRTMPNSVFGGFRVGFGHHRSVSRSPASIVAAAGQG